MAGSFVYNISNLFSKYAKTKPHYYLLAMMILIIFAIFFKRISECDTSSEDLCQSKCSIETYFSVSTSIILVIAIAFLISTFLYAYKITDTGGYIEGLTNIFNSQGGKNFITIMMLLLFVIYIYEFPMYGSTLPHELSKKITDQINKDPIISNKLMGIFMIFGFGIFTAYSIMITSNEVE
jgi:hypothetical protein